MGLRTEFLRAPPFDRHRFCRGRPDRVRHAGQDRRCRNIRFRRRGANFTPAKSRIKRGETIQIVNDDADLLHHAYIDSPKFSFDSGDQKPGSVTPITFAVAGDFDVLCAIHPKMKLDVHVR